MKISHYQLAEGAAEATGHTVIIDVFRAFTSACYVMDRGAARLIATGGVDTAFRLSAQIPGAVLIGERNEKMVPGFHFGNSPAALSKADFSDKTVIQTTSAGTRGIISARKAGEILTGSFVNAGALIRYLAAVQPEQVSLVSMGYAARHSTKEDDLCAEYIRNRLQGKESDLDRMRDIIRNTSGRRFFLPENQAHSPQEDFERCLQADRFDFVLKASRLGEDHYELIRIPA